MQIKPIAFVLPSVLLGSLAAVSSAEAATFSPGDQLDITGRVNIVGTNDVHQFYVGGDPEPVGSTGIFGIDNRPTSGGFSPFETDGARDPDYDILSLDFSNPGTYVGETFLNAVIPGDEFTFEITGPATGDTNALGSGFVSRFVFDGIFRSGAESAIAEAIFTAQSFGNDGSFSSTFTVQESPTDVPEPTAALAVLLVGGGVAALSRRRAEVS